MHSNLSCWAQVLAAASGSMLSLIMQAAISTARRLSRMWEAAHAWYMLPSHSTGPCWQSNVRPEQSYRDTHLRSLLILISPDSVSRVSALPYGHSRISISDPTFSMAGTRWLRTKYLQHQTPMTVSFSCPCDFSPGVWTEALVVQVHRDHGVRGRGGHQEGGGGHHGVPGPPG